MSKRFIDPNWKELRKLSPDLQRAFFYCWDKADACGMYEHDEKYMEIDLGVHIPFSELAKLPDVKVFAGGRIFFTEFIRINYGTLKEGYNPHKPVYRALTKNQISSLSQACTSLEEEDKEEEEGEDEGVIGVGSTEGRGEKVLVYDAEAEVLTNPIELERICMSNGKSPPEAKELLRNYHLYLTENEKYPKTRKAVFAGFEKWVRNEKKFYGNGTKTNDTKKGTSAARRDAARNF